MQCTDWKGSFSVLQRLIMEREKVKKNWKNESRTVLNDIWSPIKCTFVFGELRLGLWIDVAVNGAYNLLWTRIVRTPFCTARCTMNPKEVRQMEFGPLYQHCERTTRSRYRLRATESDAAAIDAASAAAAAASLASQQANFIVFQYIAAASLPPSFHGSNRFTIYDFNLSLYRDFAEICLTGRVPSSSGNNNK